MKRDLELIRKIAFAVEAIDYCQDAKSITIEGHTPAEVCYHCELMREVGLLVGEYDEMSDGEPEELLVKRLTMKGHDLVDAARNETFWRKGKNILMATSGHITIELLLACFKRIAMKAMDLEIFGEV